MTACTFACLPFLGPLLVQNTEGLRESFGVIVPFSIGRVAGYTLLAGGAALSGTAVRRLLETPEVSRMVLGGMTVAVAVYLLVTGLKQKSRCGKEKKVWGKGGTFGVGAAMALNPCAPVMTLVGFAANTAEVLDGVLMGLFFGLGAVLFSLIFYGFLVGKVTNGVMMQFAGQRIKIERTAAVLLLLLGVLVFNGTIKL